MGINILGFKNYSDNSKQVNAYKGVEFECTEVDDKIIIGLYKKCSSCKELHLVYVNQVHIMPKDKLIKAVHELIDALDYILKEQAEDYEHNKKVYEKLLNGGK